MYSNITQDVSNTVKEEVLINNSIKLIGILSQVLNVNDENVILDCGNINWYENTRSTEILPQIICPPDLWIRQSLSIRDIEKKTELLQNINPVVTKDTVKTLEYETERESLLLHYEKLVEDYNEFEEGPQKSLNSKGDEGGPSTPRIKDTRNTYNLSPSKSTHSNVSQRTHSTLFSGTLSLSMKRSLSALSWHRGEFILSDLEADRTRVENGLPFYSNNSSKRNSAIGSMLSKSKIYKRLRDGHGSTSGAKGSNQGDSNRRSSVITSHTLSTNSSAKNRGSFDEMSWKDNHSITPKLFSAPEDLSQKQENQRKKFEFYVQCKELLATLRASIDSNGTADVDIIKYLIQVTKCVIIDIVHMIMDYSTSVLYNPSINY